MNKIVKTIEVEVALAETPHPDLIHATGCKHPRLRLMGNYVFYTERAFTSCYQSKFVYSYPIDWKILWNDVFTKPFPINELLF
jgi:hypothetical protein